jgi:hypothetical protein
MQMSPKGFEKRRVCGRKMKLLRELFRESLRLLRPDAFSMMALHGL